MNAVRCVVLGLTIVVGRACSAQDSCNGLPQSPDPNAKIHLALMDGSATGKVRSDFHLETPVKSEMVTSTPATMIPRTANSKFFLINGIHLGMAIFDVEMTQRCIASHHCREANPLMPSSQAGQLSVNFAVVAYSSGISYWLKKHNSKLWWLPPSAGVAVHSVGVATGFEHQ